MKKILFILATIAISVTGTSMFFLRDKESTNNTSYQNEDIDQIIENEFTNQENSSSISNNESNESIEDEVVGEAIENDYSEEVQRKELTGSLSGFGDSHSIEVISKGEPLGMQITPEAAQKLLSLGEQEFITFIYEEDSNGYKTVIDVN